MAQSLRALAALPEGPESIPSILVLLQTVMPVPGNPLPAVSSSGCRHASSAQTYTQAKHTNACAHKIRCEQNFKRRNAGFVITLSLPLILKIHVEFI